jgi:hypothetical protein
VISTSTAHNSDSTSAQRISDGVGEAKIRSRVCRCLKRISVLY